MDFISFINIKTPQLIGIILGCIVFWITIFVVVYLLYASGALSNVFSVKDSIGEINKTSDPIRYFPFFQFPRLYDNLLQAASTLPLKPNITHSKGKLVRLCKLDSSQVATLVNVSDGSAIFGESAYDPVLLWGWIESALKFTESKHSQLLDSSKIRWPSHSIEDFSLFYGISDRYSGKDDELHSVIVDMELDKPIGMISILHNNPKHLSASLGNIWITPKFQDKKRAFEAMFLICKSLFEAGYRRISVETDSRHVAIGKFLKKVGFQFEAILRKHKIMLERNCDTSVYALLNSEWPDVEIRAKRYLGLPLTSTVKAANII